MLKAFSALGHFLRTLALLGLVGLLGAGGWLGYREYNARALTEKQLVAREAELAEQKQKVQRLQGEVAQQAEHIERLDTAMQLLKVDHRVAQIVVLSQETDGEGQVASTTFNFVEVDEEDNPLDDPRVFTIEGDLLYIDAWVAKFADEYVEEGDPLRSTSVCLFRRLFGENQAPADGFELDAIGVRPHAYSRGDTMSDLERELWDNFWDFAHDRERAADAGVRAIHGEAPSIQLRQGNLYKVTLRASGGLSIESHALPAALRGVQ